MPGIRRTTTSTRSRMELAPLMIDTTSGDDEMPDEDEDDDENIESTRGHLLSPTPNSREKFFDSAAVSSWQLRRRNAREIDETDEITVKVAKSFQEVDQNLPFFFSWPWQRIRFFSVTIVVAVWIALLTFAIIGLLYESRVPCSRPQIEWWQSSPVYSVAVMVSEKGLSTVVNVSTLCDNAVALNISIAKFNVPPVSSLTDSKDVSSKFHHHNLPSDVSGIVSQFHDCGLNVIIELPALGSLSSNLSDIFTLDSTFAETAMDTSSSKNKTFINIPKDKMDDTDTLGTTNDGIPDGVCLLHLNDIPNTNRTALIQSWRSLLDALSCINCTRRLLIGQLGWNAHDNSSVASQLDVIHMYLGEGMSADEINEIVTGHLNLSTETSMWIMSEYNPPETAIKSKEMSGLRLLLMFLPGIAVIQDNGDFSSSSWQVTVDVQIIRNQFPYLQSKEYHLLRTNHLQQNVFALVRLGTGKTRGRHLVAYNAGNDTETVDFSSLSMNGDITLSSNTSRALPETVELMSVCIYAREAIIVQLP